MPDAWTLVWEGFDPDDEGRREALCTLGNGRFATRGAAPESTADGVHYPGTYAAGCYNRLRDEIDGVVVENESVVNLPNWLDLRVAIEDGDWLQPSDPTMVEQRVELDLRRGVLVRVLRFVDPVGRRTAIRQRRFVHMAQSFLAGLHTVVTAENWSGRLRIEAGIDGRVTNTGVARYRDLASDHLETIETARPAADTVVLTARCSQSRILIAEAVRVRLVGGATASGGSPQLSETPGRVRLTVDQEVRAGETVAVEKIASLVTSRDPAVSEPSAAAASVVSAAPTFEELLQAHELAWHQLWRRFRLDLTEGAESTTVETLRSLRLNLFHVLQTLSSHNLDLDAGIPARGLHGEAYRGHVFWDELFVVPLLTLRSPGLVRTLLRYRTRRLDAARRAAREAGHTGAMYPWQSGSEGREESQRVHLNPRSGRWAPDTSSLQRHVGLAVAYNIWQYYQATADLEFLADHGAETLLEITRFFAGSATYDPARDRFRIRGVMGPDEYSTRYPGSDTAGVDDNAYTNIMTVWLLARAEDVLTVLPVTRRNELIENLGITPVERLRWRNISRRMYVPIAPDGIISQFEGYRNLPELDWEDYRRRYGDIRRLDRILESEGRSVDDFQVSKQADVLMLFFVFSADELRSLLAGLGYTLPPEVIPRTIEYYVARTAHGSTLSALVHAWVLARAHRAQALEHFEQALQSDIADVQGGTTAEGIHLGAMAGCVDLLQRCFAGLETRHDALWFNPHWPRRFGRLEFSLQYRGRPVTVVVADRDVHVTVERGPGGPVRVGCGDDVRALHPAESVRFTAVGVLVESAEGDRAR